MHLRTTKHLQPMHPILRNILAVIAGIVAGGFANMGIIMLSGSVMPPPEGVDPTDMASIRANLHLYRPMHFLFPFLAHALGSFVGAFVAAKLAASHRMAFAMGLGVFTMLGGIAAAVLIPAPTWFIVVDLSLAYLPTAWLAGRLAR